MPHGRSLAIASAEVVRYLARGAASELASENVANGKERREGKKEKDRENDKRE